ncbi:inositol monophosphatase [Marinomonas rhizomae]|uniref:Nus factor SuhB n=1 Tax=Marinomonas rhizomae TaxID=491948 RepID=A0A366JAC4_9GAMM|nr:inositol monophosphatase [Marinomonas rhizomae]RBP83961.1 myo-inositol-1(or 4)-monophosphatase [Marinomonas rhizomae]RNF73341.1 inositol monophosphatase [Marinomonas rhizomae]
MFLAHNLIDQAIVQRFEQAEKVIKVAGSQALEYFRNREKLVVETKMEPQDVVSIADRNVEITIIEGLQTAFPHDSFLGEEQGITQGDNQYLWVIDPIDGTACFLNGMHSWCISVALMVNDKIACGLIFDPNSNELFSAVAGKGCFVNDKKVETLNVNSLQDGVMGLGTSHRVPAELCVHFVDKLLNQGGMFIRNGSGALMLAYVAAGRLIGYYEPHINSWDCLAGLIMVDEAGGSTNDFLSNDGLLKGNPIIVSASGIKNSLSQMIN